jgi:nitrite reductase/ring-hydroxylating ferredoxin subunit
MGEHVVATVDEIPPGERLIVELEGRSIGVFNVGGDFVAIRNRCPHQGAPLCLGRVVSPLESSRPGEYRVSRARELIRCPWHGWEFDLRTGRSWFDPERTRVRSYEVGLRDPPAGEGAPRPGLRPGPYHAERFPVAIDRRRVVVTV